MGITDVAIIKIDNTLALPLYKQIVASVYEAIADGTLKNGDILPSVNSIAAMHSLARGSIFKAYNELKTAGIIDSTPGKGYFVTSTNVQLKKNIFLLLSTFNPYREVLYNAFIEQIRNQATVDLYFHHHNINVFETLVRNHAAYYNTFVIMPEINKKTGGILKQLDPKKLYILDSGLNEFGSVYPCVCQNYEKDISGILKAHFERLKKYKRIVLLFPDNIKTEGVVNGFKAIFKKTDFPAEVIRNTLEYEPLQFDCCITMDDNDLVKLMRAARKNKWKLGTDIGILSYNETPLKSIIADGITTITTDFEQMGKSMADMVIKNKPRCIENPFLMIDRKSF
ncbi:DNA-binding transcriptional regulator YhcF (GntR family) [Pedobacter africanus]|uniref:DNA-binding transcriptional regulator YhcF (GntR family) n=1 Tax=Pedobacter africanus TaxID=151894 RepID=A0ACC6KZV5_9SPHI|nr:GntR family transcriptional regulator [Pedobacter africanus]MDR6784884.1 DNA-binding transcriptional regulator YhcF (GntR family) [Pedobacter africanus]